jgi:hypothetical protein
MYERPPPSLPLIEQAKDAFLSQNTDCIIIDKYLRRAKESMKDQLPGVICYVLRKKVTNALGIENDVVYYYLIARDYWFYSWADSDHANVSKYKNSPGGGLDSEIANQMIDSKTIGTTSLVVAVPNSNSNPDNHKELQFWSISAILFKELIERHSTLHKGRFNHIDYGYAKEWLELIN